MKEEMSEEAKKVTVIMVPYPAQGHLTPMLHLASSLLHLPLTHFSPVLLLPRFLHRRICSTNYSLDPRISLVPIPPPDEEEEEEEEPAGDFFAVDKAMEQSNAVDGKMEAVVRRYVDDGGAGVCMVVDLLVSSAIDVARRCGVAVAGFWPAALLTYRLVAAIPLFLAAGVIHPHSGIPWQSGVSISELLPHQPPLSTDDLPWLIGSPAARRARFKFWSKTLQRSTTLQCLLVNSFPDDDHHHHSSSDEHKHPQILQIGASLAQTSTVEENRVAFWEQDSSCLQWLDTQKPNSVLYISFGSWVTPIGESKVKCLATSLEAMGFPFIWVLAPAWRQGLPSGYEEELDSSRRGRVVAWAPQMEVLRHGAVGCYLTHCGWNSTVEAIQCRKRMLCYPIAGDQFVNCGYIVEKWRVGLKLGGFGREDLEEGLKKVVGDGEISGRLERLWEMSLGDEARVRARGCLNEFVDLVVSKR